MTRCALPMMAALLIAGCGGGTKTPAPASGQSTSPASTATADQALAEPAPPTETPAQPATDPATDVAEDSPDHAGEHAAAEEVAITGDKASYTAMSHDGWMVMVTPSPAKPAVGSMTWDVLVHAPGHQPVEAGRVEIGAEGVEDATGKKLDLVVTAGEPGKATIVIPVAAPGDYEVEFHLERPDGGGDSHVSFTFSVA